MIQFGCVCSISKNAPAAVACDCAFITEETDDADTQANRPARAKQQIPAVSLFTSCVEFRD